MKNAARSERPALMAALLAGGALVVLALLRGADSPLSSLTRLDLGFAALPLTLCGLLLALGWFTLWLRGTQMAERVTWQLQARNGATRVLRLATALTLAQRLLADLGWAVLGLGLLSSLPELPRVVSGHPWLPDIASLGRYLDGFGSLAVWGIFLLAPFITARAVAEVRPNVGAVVEIPRRRLAALGAAYALLADDGALSAAFGLDGFWVLFGLVITLVFSVAASVLRGLLAVAPPEHPQRLRTALRVAEAGWVVALLGAMAALPYAVEAALAGVGEADTGSLNASYLVLLLPFALILYTGVLRPVVADLLGVPVGHIVLLAIVYVMFSGNGVIATAFAVDVSGMFAALTAAAVLSYAAMALRNVPKVDVPERYVLLTAQASRSLSALGAAAALALVVGAGLAHLPAANAVLLERPGTRELGETVLPFLGGFYEARYSIAGLSFAAALVFFLSSALRGAFQRYQPLLSAVSCFALGCLTWLVASGLSPFGHGFTFAGAISASGLFALGLTRLARYATSSPNPAVADIAGWLLTSRVRGFVLGAAVAFYVLLLRPVVYQVLWFAPLYEYVALLVLLLAILMNVVNKLRLVANAPQAADPAWAEWAHHRQVLESKPDPRAELTDELRQRFVYRGDWKPLWVYLFALLYRNGAPLDAMLAVCRSLRSAAAAPRAWDIFNRSRRSSNRTAAIEHSLDTVGWGLASASSQIESIHEDHIREAAAPFLDRGTDPERLAVALIVAHCQRGDDVERAVDRWFSLLDTPDPARQWFVRPWDRSKTRPRTMLERFDLVNDAVASLFGEVTRSEVEYPEGSSGEHKRSRL
ncbi:MAG: hypothetical protein OXE50_11440 [Chloroflexi bacterium]|nr:hypothetical protein [Chloroflexota bacterium]